MALRPSGIFGEGDRVMVPTLVRQAKLGKMKFIIGNGKNQMDFTYAGNVAQAHLQVAPAGAAALLRPLHLLLLRCRHGCSAAAAAAAAVSAALLPLPLLLLMLLPLLLLVLLSLLLLLLLPLSLLSPLLLAASGWATHRAMPSRSYLLALN